MLKLQSILHNEVRTSCLPLKSQYIFENNLELRIYLPVEVDASAARFGFVNIHNEPTASGSSQSFPENAVMVLAIETELFVFCSTTVQEKSQQVSAAG